MPEEDRTTPATAPLSTPTWLGHGETLTGTSFLAMLRRLPALLTGAARLGWRASRRDTALAVALTVAGGVFTAVGVLATTNVAAALLTAGPSADRVRAALPALVTVAAALSLRSALSTAAGWAQGRLEPRVVAAAEIRFVELTTSVEVAAFDDPGFADELERTGDRGTDSAGALVREGIDLLSALVGVVAAMAALFVVHPVLVPLMVLAVAPVGWASLRSARIRYASLFRRIARHRRLWVLEQLMAERDTAAELRTYGMRGFLLEQYEAVITAETTADLEVVRGQTVSRAAGAALSGIAGAGVWTVLGLLIATGRVPLAAAASGVVALQTVRGSLQQAVTAVNGLRWPFTARENVQVGDVARADADGGWAVAAAVAVGADPMIRGLTRGYDTLLDRTFAGGQDLSGGEWQRLAAARATYRDAPLLICDEPSAALDARAEHALFAQLRSRGPDRTTVLVSHRLANVRQVDRIYVLHEGRLVEQGDHDELVAAGGRYAELFALQAAGYR